jgi:hypothetical protein
MLWRGNYLRWLRQGLIFGGIAAGCLPASSQQEAPKQVLVEQSTLEGLLARIDKLESRVEELEGRKAAADLTAAAEGRTPLPLFTEAPMSMTTEAARVVTQAAKKNDSKLQVEAEQDHSENQMERMDVSQTLLRIRGFGDISFHGDTHPGDKTAFSLGQLDLFVTSDVSDRL